MIDNQIKPTPSLLKVVVALIEYQDKLLISYYDRVNFQYLWEFPGGKVKIKESIDKALKRELKEEVNLLIKKFIPLNFYEYSYDLHKNLLLYPFIVKINDQQFKDLKANEKQIIQFIDKNKILKANLLPGSYGALYRYLLPNSYMISTQCEDNLANLLQHWEKKFNQGIRLIQLRDKNLSKKALLNIARELKKLAKQYSAHLLINDSLEIAQKLAIGLHLSSSQLMQTKKRALSRNFLISTSVHNDQEFALAKKFADIALCSPVKSNPYSSQQNNQLLSHKKLSYYAKSHLIIYALGGMNCADINWVKSIGLQGIAGIRAFNNKNQKE